MIGVSDNEWEKNLGLHFYIVLELQGYGAIKRRLMRS